MAKRIKLHEVRGTSTTGTPHGLLVERDDDKGVVLFTVVGADGKKRHASVQIGFAEYYAMVKDMDSRF